MATVSAPTGIEQIGVTAGEVWRYLEKNGPQTLAQVVKGVDAPRDVVMQAIGWLAREDKLLIEENARRRYVALRQQFSYEVQV